MQVYSFNKAQQNECSVFGLPISYNCPHRLEIRESLTCNQALFSFCMHWVFPPGNAKRVLPSNSHKDKIRALLKLSLIVG